MDNKDIKIIAFHLPQYHTFPENDEWWGKGFTEWVNVKKAQPLFKGHNQPRVPVDDNYYDLTDIKALEYQMEIAQKNSVYGFCYYHYWFNGKLLLNKPLELMLTMEKKIPYFFCWANEPWTRSWDGKESEILMPQYYGNEQEWEEHFQYMLQFFKDSYYIKKDNKPVYVIYRTNNIPRCEEMIEYWSNRCKESGFDGIYIIEEKNSFQDKAYCANSAAVLEFEPMYTASNLHELKDKIRNKTFQTINSKLTNSSLGFFDYDHIWSKIVDRKHNESDKTTYLGGFVDWDNTPRKGEKGNVFLNSSPQVFEKYLRKQIENAKSCGSEFIFINAWNEWGEGTYLEPDTKYGFGYLEAVSRALKNE